MMWAILKRIALALGVPADMLDIDAQRRAIHETIAEYEWLSLTQ